MPRTIRYHLDEHCPHAVAVGLRRLGIDVTTTTDAALLRSPDEQHIAFALAERRVIFSQDEDFLALAARGTPHAGIVYCRQQIRSIGEIIATLTLLWEVYEPEEIAGRVEYIEVRPLDQ
jgi:predicted nuclease of predicted toxin-antitoxin system